MSQDGSTCRGRFVKEATSARISKASRRVAPNFASYGDRFRSGNRTTRPEVAWMVGYEGPRAAIDPKSRPVLLLAAHIEHFAPCVCALCYDWSSR